MPFLRCPSSTGSERNGTPAAATSLSTTAPPPSETALPPMLSPPAASYTEPPCHAAPDQEQRQSHGEALSRPGRRGAGAVAQASSELAERRSRIQANLKKRGLQNEDLLATMFEDFRSTGEDHWCHSSGIPPTQASHGGESSAINLDEEDEGDNDDDSEPEEVTPTSAKGKRGRDNDNTKGKKPKTAGVIGSMKRWEELWR